MGTLDGANVEMKEEAGDENIFIFGLKAEQIAHWYREGGDAPLDIYNREGYIRRIFDVIRGDRFSLNEPGLFGWVYDLLVANHDPYFHLHDLNHYIETQVRAGKLYSHPDAWNRKSILNVARVGKFSSDRTIREYATDIWDAAPTIS